MDQSDAPVAWSLLNRQPSRSVRIDSSAAIRGLQWDGSFIDEVSSYRPGVYYISRPVVNGTFNTEIFGTVNMSSQDIIDAEWTDVGVEMRVCRWNTVWADIGQAYNKKVHCIEG